MLFFQFNNLAQGSVVAVHREDTFGNDEEARLITRGALRHALCAMREVGPLQDFFEVVRVVVSEDTEFCAAQPGSIHNGGVDQFINDDDVILAHERADGPDGGGVTGRVRQGGLRAFEVGQRFIQFVIGPERATNES